MIIEKKSVIDSDQRPSGFHRPEMDSNHLVRNWKKYLQCKQKPDESNDHFLQRLQQAELEAKATEITPNELFVAVYQNGTRDQHLKEVIEKLGSTPTPNELKDIVTSNVSISSPSISVGETSATVTNGEASSISSPTVNGEEASSSTSGITLKGVDAEIPKAIDDLDREIKRLNRMSLGERTLAREIAELRYGKKPLLLVECKKQRSLFGNQIPPGKVFVVIKNAANEIEIDYNVQGKI